MAARNPIYTSTNYRLLFLAQIFALTGTGIATIGLALLAYELAGEDAGQILGTALAIKMIAYVTLAPMFTAFANRMHRKWVLIAADIVRAVMMMAMFFVSQAWQIYLLMFAINAASAMFTPIYQSSLSDILPDEGQYTRALSNSRLAYDLENLISPVLALLLLNYMQANGFFAVNALAFLFSSTLIMFAVIPMPIKPGTGANPLTTLKAGFKIYFSTPRLRALFALSMVIALAGAMVIVNTVVIATETLAGSEQDATFLYMAYGAGSIIAALILPIWLNHVHDRIAMLLGAMLLITGLALGAFTGKVNPSLWIFMTIWMVLGLGNGLVLTPAGRLIRRSSHLDGQAQIFASQFALSHLCWLVAYPLAGWLGSVWGMGTTFTILAVLAAIFAILGGMLWRPIMGAPLEHSHPAHSHTHIHTHDAHHQHDHEGWEGPEPHSHPHDHPPLRHRHNFVVDDHHPHWPRH